jgi:hypothetical protein
MSILWSFAERSSRGGPLYKKYLVYLDRVAIAAYPENYEDRLTEMFPGSFEHLRLMALDPYEPCGSRPAAAPNIGL